MPVIKKIFTYTGTLQTVTIPPGVSTMDVKIWGGAGGGGGSDAGGPGGSGSSGHYVSATGIDISSYAGQTLKVAVGGGGGTGASGGGAPGGDNGKSITGYSGGDGGSAGPNPYSGGGGGGGGATVILIDSTEIAIAGGGAGGGGAGQGSNGTAGINTNSATAGSPSTLGENGANHTGDGGGGGAGGGGDAGGIGGNGGSGDNGGTGGRAGSNLIPGGGSEDNGSGRTPGGTGDSDYVSGVALGATGSGTSGGNGLAVVTINVEVNAKYKVSGAWKNISEMYTKVAGVWKKITAAYVKVGSTWKPMFNSGIAFISTAAGFGDATGNSASGTPGSGGGCFLAGTMVTMADGSAKPIEQVDLKDEVAVGGYVFATGKFLIDNLYDYKGIKVAGSHMVKEEGRWTRVENSKLGISLGDDEHTVYVFGSENRRIIIEGVEFTDYFELSEQQELLNHGEAIFRNWQDHDRQIHDKNVNILNA